jgi:hypothetical protein
VRSLPPGAGRYCLLDNFNQASCCFNGTVFSFLPNKFCYPGGPALFAILPDNFRQLFHRKIVYKCPGSQSLLLIHPHVQRRVVLVAEPPVRVVQLVGRYPQIKQNSIYFLNLQLFQDIFQIPEVSPGQVYSGTERGQPFLRCGQRLQIPVQAHQASLFANLTEYRGTVPCTAQGAINIDATRF